MLTIREEGESQCFRYIFYASLLVFSYTPCRLNSLWVINILLFDNLLMQWVKYKCKQLNMRHWEKWKIIFTWMGKYVSPTIFSFFFNTLIINIYIMEVSLCVAKRRPLFWNICPCFLIYLCVLNEAGTYTAVSELTPAKSHRESGMRNSDSDWEVRFR